jgi:D-amino-acid dehydrogenase
MARTDAIVLGAGIIGTSIALHLVKRGLSVALLDRRAPGEETSYGNSGVIEGNTVFPHPFPTSLSSLLRVALKQAPEANYHLADLPSLAPWLLAYRKHTQLEDSVKFAEAMRPLFGRALAEHEALMAESRSTHYLRKDGWLKIYRSPAADSRLSAELDLATRFGLSFRAMDADGARELEPSLVPVFRRAVHWPNAASVSNPLGVTKAYVAQFVLLGGIVLKGDARTLHRSGNGWRVDTDEGALDSKDVVVALGPWAPDVLDPLGLRLPLAVKRGYHRHYRPKGNAALTRPVVDTDNGYLLAPMEQGLRLTTGAEFARRDAPPTPVQFDRLLPAAKELFPLGEQAEPRTWMGSRPSFADSMPVIGAAPGHTGLWLAYGHAHWGLTLGPVTGRLIAEMVTGAAPFCDPKPYAAERFASDAAA